MNLLDYKMNGMRNYLIIFAAIALSMSACKKDSTPVFGVNDVDVSSNTGDKDNLKSATEFISIAYADIFQTTVTSQTLDALTVPYVAFGDNTVIEDMIIRNFLNEPTAIIPSEQDMRADIPAFINEAYSRFYNREPDAFEAWQWEEYINSDQDLTVEVIYYAFMTSEEYRYY